jgi:hypothetical protein
MKAIVTWSIVTWGVTFCLLAVFYTSSSMSSSSTAILSLDDMQKIRGADYQKCKSQAWGTPEGWCDTKDCWYEWEDPPGRYVSYKRFATNYYKCDSTTEHYACEMIEQGQKAQICALGAKYLGAYCQSEFKLGDVEWWITQGCNQWSTT